MKYSVPFRLLLGTLLLLLASQAVAQDRVNVRGDKLRRPRGMGADVLTGNVYFSQAGTEVYCDSAVWYKDEQRVNAFGRVRVINQEDSVRITSKELYYDAGTRNDRLRNNVVYRGPDFTLRTDFMDYNMNTRESKYFNGGRVVDEDLNLTSVFGHYQPDLSRMTFIKRVVLVDAKGTVRSDTLVYNTLTGIADFKGMTTLRGEDGQVMRSAEGMQYNMETRTLLGVETNIEGEDYLISGDESFFDQSVNMRRITGNVELFSKSDSVWVYGNEAFYSEELGVTRIFGNPILKKSLGDQDTLYLTADTLVSISGPTDADKRLLGYGNVRIYNRELQGVADSLAYVFSDSTIYFYRNPAIWASESQITGDTLRLELVKGEVKFLYSDQNAFIIDEVVPRRYNQIKGKNLITQFENNRIDRIRVNGNGESIYFRQESDSVVVEMNHILCSRMILDFVGGRLYNIRFYNQPEAQFVPPHELTEAATKLEGFLWRQAERPSLKSVLGDRYRPEYELPRESPILDVPPSQEGTTTEGPTPPSEEDEG